MSHYLVPGQHPPAADNLFVAATAYHVILAHVLAANAVPDTSVLLMKRQLQVGFRGLFDSIRADTATPFCAVYLLDRPQTKYKQRWRTVIDRLRVSALRQLVDAVHPDRLFLFNEDNPDQYLARRVKAYGGTVHAVEDGAVAYTDMTMTATYFERLQSKLLFGPAALSVTVEGSSPHIDSFYARYPNQLRRELRSRPVAALPSGGLHLFDRLAWPATYVQRLEIDPECLHCDTVMLLAHSSNFKRRPDYGQRLREIVAQLVATEGRLAVSYHPREKRPDWLGLGSLSATLIPQAVPAELVYLFNRGNLQAVYGDIGTSLMTARWLLPQASTISLMDTLQVRQPAMRRMLRALDIKVR
ncbi:MAG: hypothetical protein J5I81_12500 [Nitrococcus mobilis]|nr:hypothetical protein [Nitrococcus mobilis]